MSETKTYHLHINNHNFLTFLGLKMYLNCELKGQAQNHDQCLGCRSPGCHVTDKNTQLMIGRPNYSPHFRCTKFESGDISFWEKYLSQEDVNMLCGRETGKYCNYTVLLKVAK